jgi:hypothetical protein
MPAPSSGWRRIISSKIATERIPGAALRKGTTSASKMFSRESGRRRLRGGFFWDGSRESLARRYPVAVLRDAFAAATATELVWRNFMKSLI